MCHPDCPAYIPPPPAEIKGTVTVANAVVQTREQPALKAAYVSVSFSAVDVAPYPLLGQDGNRKRAQIWTTGEVILGKLKQLNSGIPVANITGARLTAALGVLPIENQDELWVMPTGVIAVVSVINERWE